MTMNWSSWMSRLNDDTLISDISIPGTHNSAACYRSLPAVRCQDFSLVDQLAHGVRFFDIRLGRITGDTNELQVTHGFFSVKCLQRLRFSLVLEDLYCWLQENVSETIIISIKQEGHGKWSANQFASFLHTKYILKNSRFWHLDNQVPELGQVRGKIILFRRFQSALDMGIDAAVWQYNTTLEEHSIFAVQDYCEIKHRRQIKTKLQYIKTLLDIATRENALQSSRKLFINFCSASNLFNPHCWPKRIAEKLNTLNLVSMLAPGCGVLIVDYAGTNNWSIVQNVVLSNF